MMMRKLTVLAGMVVFGWGSVASATSYATAVLSDNPVAYWRMGETSGPIVDEVSGRTGTLSGGNTTGVPGAIVGDPDTAISSGPGGGTISVPFDVAINSSTFTIELWARFGSNCTDGTGSGNHCAVAGSPKPTPYQGYDLGPLDTGATMTHHMFLNSEGPPISQAGISGPPVLLNQWYHLVGTYDGSTQRFYVDGDLVGSLLNNFTPEQSRPFQLFGSSNKAMENGTIDEVAYYNYALGADRVSNHYLTGVGGVPEPTTGLLLGLSLLGVAVRRRV